MEGYACGTSGQCRPIPSFVALDPAEEPEEGEPMEDLVEDSTEEPVTEEEEEEEVIVEESEEDEAGIIEEPEAEEDDATKEVTPEADCRVKDLPICTDGRSNCGKHLEIRENVCVCGGTLFLHFLPSFRLLNTDVVNTTDA